MNPRELEVARIRKDWSDNPRWKGVRRGYAAENVYRLRGSLQVEHTLARRGAEKLWRLMHERAFVNSLGAMTGNQAMQQVRAGVPAIYLSGWQVAADANDSLAMYPDQSLYATTSVPTVVRRINAALQRCDQVDHAEGENDKPFLTGERTAEGFYRTRKGFDQALSRGIAYAEYADLVWCETGTPDLEFARRFAEGVRKVHPDKMLAYNCSPSFNWKKNLDDSTIARFQRELGAMGYKFQFITLAGFHALNYGMFDLAYGYARENMSAFVKLQQAEFAAAERGFTAVKHQREVGTGYFDEVTQVIQAGKSATTEIIGSIWDEHDFVEPTPIDKVRQSAAAD